MGGERCLDEKFRRVKSGLHRGVGVCSVGGLRKNRRLGVVKMELLKRIEFKSGSIKNG